MGTDPVLMHFGPEIITSRDVESTCFKDSRTSCDVTILGVFLPNFGRKRSHHVMDASCGRKGDGKAEKAQGGRVTGRGKGKSSSYCSFYTACFSGSHLLQ